MFGGVRTASRHVGGPTLGEIPPRSRHPSCPSPRPTHPDPGTDPDRGTRTRAPGNPETSPAQATRAGKAGCAIPGREHHPSGLHPTLGGGQRPAGVAAIQPRHLHVQPGLNAGPRRIGPQVGDEVVPGHPSAIPAGDGEARQPGQPPHRVQVQPFVPGAPHPADRTRPFQHQRNPHRETASSRLLPDRTARPRRPPHHAVPCASPPLAIDRSCLRNARARALVPVCSAPEVPIAGVAAHQPLGSLEVRRSTSSSDQPGTLRR